MLTRTEAEKLTAELRKNTHDFARLMREAWKGKVWVPLGYSGFREWITEAVGLSRSRGYQLVSIAVLEDAVCDAITLPDTFTISDLATRFITAYGVDRFISEAAKVTGDDPAENEVAVTKLIRDLRTAAAEEPVQEVVPLPVVSNHGVTAAAEAFKNMAASLPDPSEVDDPKMLPVVRGKIRDAVAAAEAALAEYEGHLSGKQQAV